MSICSWWSYTAGLPNENEASFRLLHRCQHQLRRSHTLPPLTVPATLLAPKVKLSRPRMSFAGVTAGILSTSAISAARRSRSTFGISMAGCPGLIREDSGRWLLEDVRQCLPSVQDQSRVRVERLALLRRGCQLVAKILPKDAGSNGSGRFSSSWASCKWLILIKFWYAREDSNL
jgi:hypothetical protein